MPEINSTITSQQPLCMNMEEATPQSWSSLGDFHHGMNAIFALLFGLKYKTGMENLITLLVVVLLFYFGLMYAAKKLKADPNHKDFGAFTNKFSILFGILALILELLLVVLSYGSVPFFLWTILTVSVVVAVVLLLRLAFVELKEELKWILDRLMEYCTRLYRGIVALLKVIKSDHRTEHKAQDQNQMMEHKAQDQNQNRSLKTLFQNAVEHLKGDFGELKQKLVHLNRRLMESNAIAAVVRASQKLNDLIIRNGGRKTEHEAQNHNHTNEVPV